MCVCVCVCVCVCNWYMCVRVSGLFLHMNICIDKIKSIYNSHTDM